MHAWNCKFLAVPPKRTTAKWPSYLLKCLPLSLMPKKSPSNRWLCGFIWLMLFRARVSFLRQSHWVSNALRLYKKVTRKQMPVMTLSIWISRLGKFLRGLLSVRLIKWLLRPRRTGILRKIRKQFWEICGTRFHFTNLWEWKRTARGFIIRLFPNHPMIMRKSSFIFRRLNCIKNIHKLRRLHRASKWPYI